MWLDSYNDPVAGVNTISSLICKMRGLFLVLFSLVLIFPFQFPKALAPLDGFGVHKVQKGDKVMEYLYEWAWAVGRERK